MPEIPFNFLHRRSTVSGYRPNDLKTGEIFIQQADNAILFKNDLGNLVCAITSSQTGEFVTTGQTGAFGAAGYVAKNETGSFVTTSQTGVFALAANTGSFVTTSQTGNFASLNGSSYLCSTQIPNITGDVCINAGSNISTVYKIQGQPIANTQPAIGQTLQYDGTSWVPGSIPAGGNGGGGLVYYFNDSVPADLPTGNLPASLSGTFELGRSGTLSQYTITKTNLSEISYDPIVGFVSDVLDPNVTAIPAGLFDFNLWASSNSATQTILQLKVYKYDGATTTATLLATSDDVYTYDGTVTAQYIMSIVLPQTSLTSTDRLFILISAKALTNNRDITLYFGGNTPSHVHTTIPSVGGSGLIKVINGVMQNPASKLVDADVSETAAIAGTKIQSNYFALASATGSFITTSQTGNFVTTSQTGVFALSANTGSFVTTSQTGAFGGSNNGILSSSSMNAICCNSSVSTNSFLGGGANSIIDSSCQAVIVGGFSNCVLNSQIASVVGGSSNCINNAQYSFLGGGILNKIFGSTLGDTNSILGGRQNNICSSECSAILGGFNNTINNSYHSSLGSNFATSIQDSQRSTIFGAISNIYNSTGVHILGSGISVSGAINTTYVNNLCVTGGYLSVGGIEENFITCTSGASGLIDFNVRSAATMYYIGNSTANFGLNLRSNSGMALNSVLEIGKTLTVTFLNTNDSTAYALTGVQIDGTGRSIKWLNGSGSYPAGNTGSIDTYSITAVKTGDNLYIVLGSQGKFV